MLGVDEVFFDSWKQLLDYYHAEFREDQQWKFRGQRDAEWHLRPTLERLLIKYEIPLEKAPIHEAQMLREFNRLIGNYRENYKPQSALECLSFIQHYGGSTRILDFSYSFYVAVFFALTEAQFDSQAAIWCFRSTAWDEHLKGVENHTELSFFGKAGFDAWKKDQTLQKPATHSLILGIPQLPEQGEIQIPQRDSKPCLVGLSSYYLNLRVVRQLGTFLVPTDLSVSYEENLQNMLIHPAFHGSMRKLVIECNQQLLKDGLRDLRRMRLTYDTLFEDLGSFMKALEAQVWTYHEIPTTTAGRPIIGTFLPIPRNLRNKLRRFLKGFRWVHNP